MIVLKILVWILIGYSVVQIITESYILKPFRELFKWDWWQTLVSCTICTGVWVGFGIGYFLWSPSEEIFDITDYRYIFFDGLLCSVTSWFIYLVENRK